MSHHSRRSFAAAAALLCLVLAISRTEAQEAPVYRIGNLLIAAPWSRETPNAARVAGGFMRITNTGTESDRLLGGTVPFAARIEVHEMTMADGVMRMRELAGGLEIKPGATVELKPGGLHLMFMGLKAPLKAGAVHQGQLTFQHAGTVDIELKIANAAARSPDTPHKH